MTTAIPVLRFDTNDFPESQRFDIWRAGITTHQVTRSGPAGTHSTRWWIQLTFPR
jgi:hypothetical protein